MLRKPVRVSFSALALFLAVTALCAAPLAAPAFAQDKELYWQRYDVDLSVQPSGDLRVTETQELVFYRGTFTYGVRTIPLLRLGDIKDITVGEEGGPAYTPSNTSLDPDTFTVSREPDKVNIRYNFPPSSARRTIVIAYTVTNALRYYPENGVDQLFWKAVPAGNPARTLNSRITLHLPTGVSFTKYRVYGAAGDPTFAGGEPSASVQLTDLIPPGHEVEVVAEWPHGFVAGTAQPWQAELDAKAKWGPVLALALGGLGLLLMIAGPLVTYLWWYRRGREPSVELNADYLAEPPSDLPPAVVGALLDGSSGVSALLSTIVDLARRGFMHIVDMAGGGFRYRRLHISALLRPYEQLLLDKVFLSGDEVKLSELQGSYYLIHRDLNPAIQAELARAGLVAASRQRARTGARRLGLCLLIMAGCAWLLPAVPVLVNDIVAILLLSLGLAAAGAAVMVAARHVSPRDEKGAEVAARWRAFKCYLENPEEFDDTGAKADTFERYLPYAVAFGIDKVWIARFAHVQAPAPDWWLTNNHDTDQQGSRPSHNRPAHTSAAGGAAAGTPGGELSASGTIPSLEEVSHGIGTRLDDASRRVGSMLSAAADTLTRVASEPDLPSSFYHSETSRRSSHSSRSSGSQSGGSSRGFGGSGSRGRSGGSGSGGGGSSFG
jgi:uncharacterized membrane protein YgcG